MLRTFHSATPSKRCCKPLAPALELTRPAGTSPKLQLRDVPVKATNERTSTPENTFGKELRMSLVSHVLQCGRYGDDSGTTQRGR